MTDIVLLTDFAGLANKVMGWIMGFYEPFFSNPDPKLIFKWISICDTALRRRVREWWLWRIDVINVKCWSQRNHVVSVHIFVGFVWLYYLWFGIAWGRGFRLEFSVRKLVISCGRLVLLSMEQEFIYRTYGSFKDLVNVYGNILEQWVKSEGIYCVSIKYATNCT